MNYPVDEFMANMYAERHDVALESVRLLWGMYVPPINSSILLQEKELSNLRFVQRKLERDGAHPGVKAVVSGFILMNETEIEIEKWKSTSR